MLWRQARACIMRTQQPPRACKGHCKGHCCSAAASAVACIAFCRLFEQPWQQHHQPGGMELRSKHCQRHQLCGGMRIRLLWFSVLNLHAWQLDSCCWLLQCKRCVFALGAVGLAAPVAGPMLASYSVHCKPLMPCFLHTGCNGNPTTSIANQVAWSCGASTASGSSCTAGCTSGYTGSATATCSLGTWDAATGRCSECQHACVGKTLQAQQRCRHLLLSTDNSGCLVLPAADATALPNNTVVLACSGNPPAIANEVWSCGSSTASGASCTGSCSSGYKGAPTAQCRNGTFTMGGQPCGAWCGVPVAARPVAGRHVHLVLTTPARHLLLLQSRLAPALRAITR